MASEIPVYKSERVDGVADLVRTTSSLAYLVPVNRIGDIPLKHEIALRGGLSSWMSARLTASQADFDLYYLSDVMVTTGWNKNGDIFDRLETWSARHTPEHKPFNFEHRPLDIIGHIVASRAVDDDMNDIGEDISVDDLPAKFHLVNGSVLYMSLEDEERKKLMSQTVEEIERGEWFVSMECYFRGFDYGVIRPDGSQHIIARNENTAFLTKHLRQYNGDGIYKCPDTGEEYTLGRVVKNITFSGKGLVRKPANPESLILNSVASFNPVTNLGYLDTRDTRADFVDTQNRAVAQTIDEKTKENTFMSEPNPDQALRDQNTKLGEQVESLQREIASLKSKDTEATITKLTKDMSDRDATIAEKDNAIASLNTQIATIKESLQTLQARAEKAETDLGEANKELTTVKAGEVRRARESVLKGKNAPEESIAKLLDRFAAFDDAAFNETVEIISAGWKKEAPETPKKKVDPVVEAVTKAKADEDPNMVTHEDTAETARATVIDFLGKSLREGRGQRVSALAGVNTEDN